MSNYGRNFEFRVPPAPAQRASRYVTPANTEIPIGAPVRVGATAVDAQGRNEVVLQTGGVAPKSGIHGILVYEYGPSAYAGTDPNLTTFSNSKFGKAPKGAPVQLVSGKEVKVVLRNTTGDDAFVGNISAPAVDDEAEVVFVAGLGATPTVQVGDLLAPGTGNATAGYWTETTDADEAWLVVTAVDAARGEVEARMLF